MIPRPVWCALMAASYAVMALMGVVAGCAAGKVT